MKMLNGSRARSSTAGAGAAFEALSILLRTLYPIAPHITQVLWDELGSRASTATSWMRRGRSRIRRRCAQDEIELVVQVNGKLRGSIRVPADADRGTIAAAALADANVQKFVAGKPVSKMIYVPGNW